MKKIIFILMILSFSASCENSRKSEVSEEETDIFLFDSERDTEDLLIDLIESIMHDTIPVFSSVNDSVVIDLWLLEDILAYEKFKADSAYRAFQQDSINFRKITKIINGGYNGWDHRYKLWINARKILEHHHNAIN